MLQNLLALVAVGLVVAVAVRWWRQRQAMRRRVEREAAIGQFGSRRDHLRQRLLAAARASGKPRGLRWTRCDLEDGQLFASDRAGGALVALVGVTVGFEAIDGQGMEEVEAVGDLRSATALFVHRQGEWTSDGRVLFNLEPAEALERMEDHFDALTDG
jgi:hypothetical protein